MKNNKGFTLVEILAVVALLGILMGLAIAAYTRYIDFSEKKALTIFRKSVINAAENYKMDHPDEDSVTIEELIEGQYLKKPDKRIFKGDYKGKISIKEIENEGGLNTYEYTISMCVGDNYYTYYPGNSKKSEDKICKADKYAEITEILNNIPVIKVLNVYPEAGNNLATWMNSYGKGKIQVTAIPISTFNANPNNYLKKENGKWKYDEIVFGFWDCNNSKDLSANAASVVDNYLNDGGAAIFGHDTLTVKGCGSHVNFNTLAKHVNMDLGKANYTATTKVKIVKKGVFTEYPWPIGDVGTQLTIPTSHVYGQIAHGDVWIAFDTTDTNEANRIYLSTYGRNAFIQTGHSNGNATPDEQKIIANIIFYMVAKQYVND